MGIIRFNNYKLKIDYLFSEEHINTIKEYHSDLDYDTLGKLYVESNIIGDSRLSFIKRLLDNDKFEMVDRFWNTFRSDMTIVSNECPDAIFHIIVSKNSSFEMTKYTWYQGELLYQRKVDFFK